MFQKNVLTIATGKAIYIKLAENLARSFYYWNKNVDIKFFIATDQENLISNDIKSFINIINITEKEYGAGFSTKLHLDKIAPLGKTLFIDSDCLIFGDLTSEFERFEGYSVSVVGTVISSGEWFGNISKICEDFGVSYMPKFNGGIYYLEQNSLTTSVYNKARELEKEYDKIGFVRLRNRPNDEVLMSLAMALHNLKPLEDDSTIMSDPQACPCDLKINVISGERLLVNPPSPHPLNQKWYPFNVVKPKIIHFLGRYTSDYRYKKEAKRLEIAIERKLNLLDELKINLRIYLPGLVCKNFKNTFRGTFHTFFGPRKIRKSERL